VTSRDEEEDEVDKGGTDSSNDTDATLVDDGPSRFSVPESSPTPLSPNSVLGKRARDPERQRSEMLVDSPTADSKDGFVMISKPSSPSRPNSPSALEHTSSSISTAPADLSTTTDIDGDVVMESSSRIELSQSQPPPLPPRKPETSDSVMMFGKITPHSISMAYYDLFQASNMTCPSAWITACSKLKRLYSNLMK
jgi:ubiquitin carboxyl-terminal hydrolase 25